MRTARKRGREAADAVDRRVAAQLEEPRAEWPRGCGVAAALPLSRASMVRRVVAVPGAVPISERVERRARWVLDMVGAPGLRLGDDAAVPARGVGGGRARRAARGRRARGGLLPPRAGRGDRRSGARRAGPLPRRLLVPRSARPAARAAAPGARASSRRATGERGSPSRSRTTSTCRGAGRGSACAARLRG